jgi:hypothetical protein
MRIVTARRPVTAPSTAHQVLRGAPCHALLLHDATALHHHTPSLHHLLLLHATAVADAAAHAPGAA